ncbi:hypothetical protein SAMN05216351_1232 [Pseudobutyrivibrio sp. JW11]|uniref:hypothetical protein n=1 Tax=Pseudobutyrivibrio sp. JW11 TaxID=1855302 RepID=UPI0008E84E8A|nr:hypothetical protein [Pseudobutyrivibrio sp. JW11]SFO64748.1 hypothetical protein SAMN05216351_1232 [Pseudobutyrivibrio sp. JW11]
MSMIVYPNKLHSALEMVMEEHPIKGERYKMVTNDQRLKELVNMVVSWDYEIVEKKCTVLKESDITELARYINQNKFKVELKNIFKTIALKGSIEDFADILEDFENSYDNEKLKSFIFTCLNDGYKENQSVVYSKTNSFIEYIAAQQIDSEAIYKILSSSDVLITSSQLASDDTFEKFRHNLVQIGIIDTTHLYSDCLSRFFLVCGEQAYADTLVSVLVNVFDGYSYKDKITFVINLLDKVSITNLLRMNQLYQKIRGFFLNTHNAESFKQELKKAGVLDKFEKWSSLVTLEVSLGDPRRYAFWKQYVLGGKLYNKAEILYIDFGEIVITEFKGKAAGPSYFYTSESFKKSIAYAVTHYSKNEVQRYLYDKHVSGFEGEIYRGEHRGDWEYDFTYYLRANGIKPVAY